MWWRRRRQRTDEEFREEIRAHVAFEADRLRDDGLEPEEARVAAHRAFGNLLAVQERFHESHRWMWVEHLTMDLRYAWRGLRSSRSVAATLTVAFGVLKLLSSVITFRNVSLIDVGAFATSVTLVAGAVVLASCGPARRATRVDPAETLRAEG